MMGRVSEYVAAPLIFLSVVAHRSHNPAVSEFSCLVAASPARQAHQQRHPELSSYTGRKLALETINRASQLYV